MKNLLLACVILCVISSGFAQHGYYYPHHRNDFNREWQPNYNYNPDYFSNSGGRKSLHSFDSEETDLYNYKNDHSGNDYEDYGSMNHHWDDYNHPLDKGCITPNGEKAQCISLNYCPILNRYSYHQHHRSNFFKKSICGHTYSGPLVCCGTKYKYKNEQLPADLPPITREPPYSHLTPVNTISPITISQTTTSPTTSVVNQQNQRIDPVTIPVQQESATVIPNLKTNLLSSTIPTITQSRNKEQISTRPEINQRSHRNFNLLPSRNTCGLQGLDDKLFGGSETGLSEFPWMTLLEYHLNGVSTGYKCGGMLINNRYILTAAHCVFGRALPLGQNVLRVRLGEHDINTLLDCRMDENNIEDCNLPPQDIDIEETIVHPGFNDSNTNMLNDIALLRLRQIPNLNEFVQPICLPTEGEKAIPGENLTISGWGVTEIEALSEIKIKASVPYIDDNQCKTLWINSRQISDNQFCAGGSDGISVCSGDSGGPIMALSPGTINWYVEGIVSFGRLPCGTFPNVFTRVSSYVNWILDSIKP